MNNRTGLLAVTTAALMILASCSTSSFMGLSKSSHVDTELEEMRTEIDGIQAMEDELDEIIDNEERLQMAIDRLTAISEEHSSELDRVVEEFSDELDGIPAVTLQQLVEAIEAYLASVSESPDQPEDAEGEADSGDGPASA